MQGTRVSKAHARSFVHAMLRFPDTNVSSRVYKRAGMAAMEKWQREQLGSGLIYGKVVGVWGSRGVNLCLIPAYLGGRQ